MQDFFCDGDSADAPAYTPLTQDAESMPHLTDEIKTFIVRGLATFETPSEVAEAVKSNFGVEITRRHVYAYDPRCTQPPAPRWCALHAATRAAFLEELAEIGIAHKAFRLRALDRMVHDALKHRYPGRVQSLLEQAAKECGGFFEQGRRRGDPAGSEYDDMREDMPGDIPEREARPPRRAARKIYGLAQIPESR